jgi:sugar transferase (PEP-CTERM system associated)
LKLQRINTRTVLLILVEAMLLFVAMITAVYLRLGVLGAEEQLLRSYGFYKIGLATFFCLTAFYLYDLYDFVVMHDRRELVLRMIQALGFAWIALALVIYLVPQMLIGRGVSSIALPLALALMVGWRVTIHYFLGHPQIGERILIVGSGAMAVEVAREVLERRHAGYRVIGFVDTDPEMVGKSLINPRVVGLTSELDEVVKREHVDRIIVAMGERRGQFPTEQLLDLSLSGNVSIEECASFYERLTGRVHLDMMRPSWLIFSGRGRQKRLNTLARAGMHRGVALTGALLSLPVAALTAILIKLDSRGPVLYRQERVGMNGQPFTLMKFRSMRTDAEKDGPIWASATDERTTRVGRIIRKIRVDEIPQFWNILKGEMSFVGPRPERPQFVEDLEQKLNYYAERHMVKPGITGWAQINYPYGASIEDSRQKLEYDLYYAKNYSPFLDILILLQTLRVVLWPEGAR